MHIPEMGITLCKPSYLASAYGNRRFFIKKSRIELDSAIDLGDPVKLVTKIQMTSIGFGLGVLVFTRNLGPSIKIVKETK